MKLTFASVVALFALQVAATALPEANSEGLVERAPAAVADDHNKYDDKYDDKYGKKNDKCDDKHKVKYVTVTEWKYKPTTVYKYKPTTVYKYKPTTIYKCPPKGGYKGY